MEINGKEYDASGSDRNAALAEERAAVRESTAGFAGKY